MDKLNDNPKSDSKIIVFNNSAFDILFSDCGTYPDTSLSKHTPFFNTERIDSLVVKHFTSKIFAVQYRLLFASQTSNFKIGVILFDKKRIETTPWDTIVKKNLVLKRYDLSLKQLDSLNWTITYP